MDFKNKNSIVIIGSLLLVLVIACAIFVISNLPERPDGNETLTNPTIPDNAEDLVQKPEGDGALDIPFEGEIVTDMEAREEDMGEHNYIDENGYMSEKHYFFYDEDTGELKQIQSVTAEFKGVPIETVPKYNGYSREVTGKTLIYGAEFTYGIDIDATGANWESVRANLDSDPKSYVGKVIKVHGDNYVERNSGSLQITGTSDFIDYICDEMPKQGDWLEMIGMLEYNSETRSYYIDCETIYRLY